MIRDKLIALGVQHLHEFGYPDCTPQNILTDRIYSLLFQRMVQGTLDDAPLGGPIAHACRAVLKELRASVPVEEPRER